MTKKDNDILARDLVLAAFIVMKRQYESRDAGRAGKLQMFLNIHAGTHGDVKNIVAILNNPKSTVKLSDDQKRIYQRALDIVESVSEVIPGWSAQVDTSNLTPEKIEVLQAIWTNTEPSALASIDNILAKVTNESMLSPEQFANIPLSGIVEMSPEQAQKMDAVQAETPKAKPGRKAKNPIETAAAKAKKKKESDPCC